MNANTPNFSSILDEAPTEINRPKALPTGTYTFIVGAWEEGKSSQKKTPLVKFGMRPIAALNDVDQDELDACLTNAAGEAIDLSAKNMSLTFYTTPDVIYRLVEFHQHCGLNISDKLSHRMRNDAVINCEVRGYVAPRESNNPDAPVFSEIKRTLPAA